MVVSTLSVELLLAGLAGGILGAAIGALPALSLAGFAIVVGEGLTLLEDAAVELAMAGIAPLDVTGITAVVGFGPVLGPHVAFAGGVAAAAYAGRNRTIDTGFRYHQAKQISKPLGSEPRTLLVGGIFGLLGVLVAWAVATAGIPLDPVFFAVVFSAFVHRLAFGYSLVGRVRDSLLDMGPYERGDVWGELDDDHGDAGRKVVEPWLPDHYEWENVAVLGAAVGILAGFVALVTGSVYLVFGIALASLAFLALGLYTLPVTHHMALPAGITGAALAGTDPVLAIVAAGFFGLVGGLLGELAQRVFYAHGDTHVDPPAISIVLTSLVIGVLVMLGVFDPAAVPYPIH